ncbi:MAG TPA: AraC family transcriptional regulator ligand-binding domain-containing protein [Pseudolabrys sp.]|jgi:AraC-like DNA-binding protein
MATGGIARLACARAKSAGVALKPLLKQADITRQQIENPRLRISVIDQIRLLNLVAAALEDDLLGFHLAETADFRTLGLFHYVLASSDVLIDALKRAERYSSIINEGILPKCVDRKYVGISFHHVGVSRHLDRHQVEFWMVAFVRACRQLTGLRLLPSRVRMIHRREQNTEFAEYFGDNIEFGAAADEITFSKHIGQSPVVSADPYLNKVLIGYCEEAISHRKKRGSFQSTVENAVVPLLPHGKARADEISRQLGLSPRTFARRLSLEGLTFSELLEGLRSDLAKRYFADRDLAISQIAWLLGYREVSSFSHAFKRWTGKTPSKARSA